MKTKWQSPKVLAREAEEEHQAALRANWICGFDTEIRCECGGYRQPNEICCGVCQGHHKADDEVMCRFRRDQRAEWERKFGRKAKRR